MLMKYEDSDWLFEQYVVLGKSQAQIGKECDVSDVPIYTIFPR
jgi:hypothetical protein